MKIDVKCAHCNKEFVTYVYVASDTPKKYYCSRACRTLARNPLVPCANCGYAVRVPYSKKNLKHYCSPECKVEHNAGKQYVKEILKRFERQIKALNVTYLEIDKLIYNGKNNKQKGLQGTKE